MGILQCGFTAEIDAVSAPQAASRWFEALGQEQDVLLFGELARRGCLFSALGQRPLSLVSISLPQNENRPLTKR